MRGEIVLDIETQNSFREVGKPDYRLLKVSLVGIYVYDLDKYLAFKENELNNLWPLLEKADRLIGFNILGFDLPVLNNYYSGNLLHFSCLDIMEEVKKTLGRRPRLSDIALGTLKETKIQSGLQAIEYFKKGDLKSLEKYCLQDVALTRKIYEFGLEKGYLVYDNKLEQKKIPVVFKLDQDQKRSINLTLPL